MIERYKKHTRQTEKGNKQLPEYVSGQRAPAFKMDFRVERRRGREIKRDISKWHPVPHQPQDHSHYFSDGAGLTPHRLSDTTELSLHKEIRRFNCLLTNQVPKLNSSSTNPIPISSLSSRPIKISNDIGLTFVPPVFGVNGPIGVVVVGDAVAVLEAPFLLGNVKLILIIRF